MGLRVQVPSVTLTLAFHVNLWYNVGMIRIENNITYWQRKFASSIDDTSLKKKILDSKPLMPLEKAFVTDRNDLTPIYSTGFFGNTYKPVDFIDSTRNREIEVIYHDFDTEQYYIGSDGRLKNNPYNSYNHNVLAWDIPMQDDKSWHKWDYVGEYDVLYNRITKNTHAILVTFVDVMTDDRFAFYTYTFNLIN